MTASCGLVAHPHKEARAITGPDALERVGKQAENSGGHQQGNKHGWEGAGAGEEAHGHGFFVHCKGTSIIGIRLLGGGG